MQVTGEVANLTRAPPKMLKAPECWHHNLKIVGIVAHRNRINAVEHVMYLINNVVALRETCYCACNVLALSSNGYRSEN